MPHVAELTLEEIGMNTHYPNYPRDSDGDIPEPLCYDLLRIWAEHGRAYLWDMNGVCISISYLTNQEGNEPLDLELEAWQSVYEGKPLTEHHDPKWDSEKEQIEFDAEGASLAKKVFEFFNKTKTVIYFPTCGGELRFDADPSPSR